MKKMWKLNNKAVSPVIATILMVAITVVLAAVLYVMVMGFGGEGGQTPSGSFTATSQMTATKEKIQFAAFEPSTNISELKFSLSKDNAVIGTFEYASGTNMTDLTGINSIDYIDIAKDGSISAGDYLVITFDTGDAGNYELTMIFDDTGDMMDSVQFTW